MALNWGMILGAIIENAPAVTKVVSEWTGSMKQTTGPATPAAPVPTPSVPSGPVERKPSETVKAVQQLLNDLLKLDPPLKVDGWLGAKTEAAIDQALAMAKPYLAMFGR